MASSISTLLSTTKPNDPLVGMPRTGSPFSINKKPAGIDFGAYKQTTGLVQPKQAPVQQSVNASSTNVASPPVSSFSGNGLLSTGSSSLDSLRKSLEGVQGGLINLQKEREQTSFRPLVEGIRSASTPSDTQTGLVSSLTRVGQENKDIAENARKISAQYGEEIARLGGLEAGARTGIGLTAPVAMGRGNLAAQSASDRITSLSQAQQAALAGTGQQLTAQAQQANALNAALSGSNVQQQQQLGGLGAAAGFAAPQFAQPGQAAYNPLDPGASIGSLTPAIIEQYAQMMATNQGGAIPSTITGNPVLNAQVIARAKQINPNFNPTIAGAQMSAIGGLVDQTAQLQAQAQGADANFQLLLNIAQQGGVNQSNVPILNTLQQNVNRGLTSQEAVANFQSILQTVRSQYASIIGGGTVTVESLNEAKSIIPDDVSLSALISLSKNLESDAQNRIQGLNNQISSLSGGASTGTDTTPQSGVIRWEDL